MLMCWPHEACWDGGPDNNFEELVGAKGNITLRYTLRKEASAQLFSLESSFFLFELSYVGMKIKFFINFFQPNKGTRLLGPLDMAVHESNVSCAKLLIQV